MSTASVTVAVSSSSMVTVPSVTVRVMLLSSRDALPSKTMVSSSSSIASLRGVMLIVVEADRLPEGILMLVGLAGLEV